MVTISDNQNNNISVGNISGNNNVINAGSDNSITNNVVTNSSSSEALYSGNDYDWEDNFTVNTNAITSNISSIDNDMGDATYIFNNPEYLLNFSLENDMGDVELHFLNGASFLEMPVIKNDMGDVNVIDKPVKPEISSSMAINGIPSISNGMGDLEIYFLNYAVIPESFIDNDMGDVDIIVYPQDQIQSSTPEEESSSNSQPTTTNNYYGDIYENVGIVNNGSIEDSVVNNGSIENSGVFTLTQTGTDSSEVIAGRNGEDVYNDVINALGGDDELKGFRGADELDGGEGDDIVRAGNGRDIITGGNGSDDIYGGFGQNTFTGEKDNSLDYIYLKSDHLAVNWLYGTSGNNAGNRKADVIASLDSFDQIFIQGANDAQLSFSSATSITLGGETVSGIGIYASNSLEAVYTGGDLTVNQINQMTSGVAA